MRYEHLVGREFVWGSDDCYGLLRDFYRDNFEIELPNYARPDDFWSRGLNLYVDHYYENGFRPIDVHPTDWQVGDVFLMAIQSNTPNHVAILVENGNILHHLYGCRSIVELYRGKWRDLTIGVFRHKDVKIEASEATADVFDLLPPAIRRKIDEAREAASVPE
jgi:cell wall-associated NlpC family hydrolase